MNNMKMDQARYGNDKMPRFQYFFRKAQSGGMLGKFYKLLFIRAREKKCIDMSVATQIGGGVYFGHPSGITINPEAIIGSNVNIHKGATIGRENRGKRKGAPIIGNDVWIGVNSTIVGAIKIGNDVLIAPNAYVNFDIPDHSIVIGNPAKIISCDNATDGYINNRVEI